jgi:hypothetical protein
MLKKFYSIGVVLGTAFLLTGASQLGRNPDVTWPDLGDAAGSSQVDTIQGSVEEISDDMNSRYEVGTAIADSTLTTFTHNFGVAFSELTILLYTGAHPSLTRVSDPAGAGWTIAANGGSPLTAIDVTTPGSGGPHTFAVQVIQHPQDLTAFDDLSPLTTRGDLLTRDASTSVRLAVGSADQVLVSDATDPSWSKIVDANVDAAAAIAGSKIVAATAAVNGVMTTGSQTMAGDKFFNGSVGAGGITTFAAEVELSVDGDFRIDAGASISRRISFLDQSAAYAVGSSGGAAILFEQDGSGHHEIAFEVHESGVSHFEAMRIEKEGDVEVKAGHLRVSGDLGETMQIKNTLSAWVPVFQNDGSNTAVFYPWFSGGSWRVNNFADTQTNIQTTDAGAVSVFLSTVDATGDVCATATGTGLRLLSACSSSRRYKENIRDITNEELERFYSLRGVHFDWKPENGDRPDFGLIAEEVDQVFPELAPKNEAGQPESVNYKHMVGLLVEVIKDLNKRIQALEQK